MTPTSESTSSEFPESNSTLIHIIVVAIMICAGLLVIFIIVCRKRWEKFCTNKLKSYRKNREVTSNRDEDKSSDEQEAEEML